MNILYIGPFQQNNSLGHCSSVILQDLCSLPNHRIFAYPIYSGYDNISVSRIPYLRIKELTEYPDAIIHHCTINNLYIDRYSKNYFIPIHNLDVDIPKKYHDKLKDLDRILVYNDFDYQKYSDIGIDAQHLSKIEPPYIKVSDNILDIGIYKQYHKYYFIGYLKDNLENIKRIMYNFLHVAKFRQNICLIICAECDRQYRQNIVAFYNEIKNELCMTMQEDKILFMLDEMTIDTIERIHRTCDTFLCLNNSFVPLADISMAKSCNNDIIHYNHLDLDIRAIGYNQKQYFLNEQSLRNTLYENKAMHNGQDTYVTIEHVL